MVVAKVTHVLLFLALSDRAHLQQAKLSRPVQQRLFWLCSPQHQISALQPTATRIGNLRLPTSPGTPWEQMAATSATRIASAHTEWGDGEPCLHKPNARSCSPIRGGLGFWVGSLLSSWRGSLCRLPGKEAPSSDPTQTPNRNRVSNQSPTPNPAPDRSLCRILMKVL